MDNINGYKKRTFQKQGWHLQSHYGIIGSRHYY